VLGGLGAGATVLVGAGAALGPAPGAAAVLAVAAGLLVLRRPVLGALVLVSLVPAIAGLARGLPLPGLRLSEVVATGVSALILLATPARRAVPWRAFDWLALAYVAATAGLGALNLLRRGDPFTAEAVGVLFGPLQFLLLYRAVLTALPEADQRRRALRWMLAASLPVSLLALSQQYDVPGARDLVVALTGSDIYSTTVDNTFGFEQSAARATGPFPHWHDLGGYLVTIVLLCVGLLLERGGKVLPRRWLALILVPAVIALVQTASLAPLAAAVVGVVALGVWTGHGRLVLVWLVSAMLVSAVVFAPLIGSRLNQQFGTGSSADRGTWVPSTIAYRYDVWQQFTPVIAENAVTGYGPVLPPDLYFPHTESLYVEFLMRGGVILLAVYLALTWALAAMALRTVRRGEDPDQRVVGRVVALTVATLVPIHLIATYFIDSGPPHLLWALAGLLLHARRSG
jgi:hypothetical protein